MPIVIGIVVLFMIGVAMQVFDAVGGWPGVFLIVGGIAGGGWALTSALNRREAIKSLREKPARVTALVERASALAATKPEILLGESSRNSTRDGRHFSGTPSTRVAKNSPTPAMPSISLVAKRARTKRAPGSMDCTRRALNSKPRTTHSRLLPRHTAACSARSVTGSWTSPTSPLCTSIGAATRRTGHYTAPCSTTWQSWARPPRQRSKRLRKRPTKPDARVERRNERPATVLDCTPNEDTT